MVEDNWNKFWDDLERNMGLWCKSEREALTVSKLSNPSLHSAFTYRISLMTAKAGSGRLFLPFALVYEPNKAASGLKYLSAWIKFIRMCGKCGQA